MNARHMRHTIFETRWGYFGLLCRGEALCRTVLPVCAEETARAALTAKGQIDPANIPFEKNLLADLQKRIIAYFEGENVDFSSDPPADLSQYTPFGRAILTACRQIPFGQTRTYRQLALAAGVGRAAQAVGNMMARNPIPLIVPCHRVIRTDGGLGGFSAAGGTATKRHLLAHERFEASPSLLEVGG